MNKNIVKVIAFVIAAALIITSFSFVVFLPSAFGATKEDTSSREYLLNRLVILEEYLEFIEKYYKDSVDYENLMDSAMEGATEALGDPYSVFYLTEKEKDNFVENVSGEYAGIGVTLQHLDGRHKVVSVNAAGPSLKAGVEVGDFILKVDNKDVTSSGLEEVVSKMKGESGTKVVLTVERNGQQKDITIIRQVVTTESISYKNLDGNIGYMKISGFDSDVGKEFQMAKIALVNKGAEALIIDMRDNPGGYIQGAIEIADQIIPEGYIVHYERQGKLIGSEKVTGAAGEKMPIAVLVNEESASSTELLAGALQDNKAASIVGTTTFGKGVAQQVISLSSGDSAKISTFYFLTPNKKRIDHVGITPDYVVRNTVEGSKEDQEIYGALAPMNANTKPIMGDTDLNVYAAQQRLSFLGYYKGSFTGTMDETTAEALKRFQKDEGLYPYVMLDDSTKSALQVAAYGKAYGRAAEDLQLKKAVELLKK